MSLILGLTGPMASGKTTVATYVKEMHGATTHRFSTMMRDVLDRLYIEQTRGNLQTLSTIVRQSFGEDTFAKVMAEDVKNDTSNIVVVEGIRRPDDAVYLRELPNFILVAIDADEKIRFNRISARSENPDDQGKTFEQFRQEQAQESEQKIVEIMKDATVTLNNNGSMEELYAAVENILSQYGDQG